MNKILRSVSLSLLAFVAINAFAQEEGLLEPANSTTSAGLGDPPTVAGAWAGSAAANLLLEDGSFIPSSRSPWALSWFNWANVNMRNYREGSGRLETYNYLSADYRLNWDSKVSIRPEFYVAGAGKDFFGEEAKGETEMGDIYAQYTHNSIALVPTPIGDMGLSGSARIYYPNSEYAKMQRQITKLQARLMFSMPMGYGLWLTYHFRPTYLVQRQKAYLNEFFNPKSNEHYRLEQRLEVTKQITSRVALSQQAGVEHRHYYASAPNNLQERTDAYLGLSTSVSWFLGAVSFRGGLNYETKLARPGRNDQIYNETDTTYFLMTSVRM